MIAIALQDSDRSRARMAVAAAMVVALGASLCGCETIERGTGFNRSTQRGAVGGAAFGGIVAALANANPAWIAASVIMGGIAGGAISNHLGRKDAERHARANLGALDTLNQGRTESRSNNRTGNHGSTTVTRVDDRDGGGICKSYRETVHAGAETVIKEGAACRYPGGTWKLV